MAPSPPTQMRQRSLLVVNAGLSQPSATRLLAERLAASSARSLGVLGVAAGIVHVDLRDHAQDLTNHLLTGFPSPRLQAVVDGVAAADGLIAVTPIYSASYSGLFKMFFDVLERDRLAGMPTLVAATAGTARHSLALDHALRPLFAYLGAAVVPTAVFAAAEDWGEADASGEASLVERIERAAKELATSVAARERRHATDAIVEPVPFEQLLTGERP